MPPKHPKPEQDAPQTPSVRHRRRVMAGLQRWCRSLSNLATMLVYRYRSEEAGETLRAHLLMLEEVRSPAEACDILGQILEEGIPGTIKPPQLEVQVNEVMQHLLSAASSTDAERWPVELLAAAQKQQQMFNPYGSASADVTRLPTGTYLIVIGSPADVHVPAASHSNSVVSSAAPATSSKAMRRSSGKVRTADGAASTIS